MRINIPSLGKEVLVQVPPRGNLTKNFQEAAIFVKGLVANNRIRDLEAGVNPPGATHEVVKDDEGNYHLKRFRFG